MNKISFEQFNWIDVDDKDMSSAENFLRQEGLPNAAELLLEMPMERPSIDTLDDVIVASLQFPNWKAQSGKVSVSLASLRIVLSADMVVTVHPTDSLSMKKVRAALAQGRISNSISPSRFVGELLRRAVKTRFEFIDELTVLAKHLEERVFDKADERDLIEDLMDLKMEISNARRIAPPQQEVVNDFAKEVCLRNWDDDGLLDDLTSRIKHVITLLEGLKDRAEILTEANEAFLNHSLNSTLRFLTVFSVVMITPSLLASIFGMNAKVPWEDHRFGFLIMTCALGLVTLGSALLFKFRRNN